MLKKLERKHNDIACKQNYLEMLIGQTKLEVLQYRFDMPENMSKQLEPYFDKDKFVGACMKNYDCDCDECPFWSESN